MHLDRSQVEISLYDKNNKTMPITDEEKAKLVGSPRDSKKKKDEMTLSSDGENVRTQL